MILMYLMAVSYCFSLFDNEGVLEINSLFAELVLVWHKCNQTNI